MSYIFPTEALIEELTTRGQQNLGEKTQFLGSLGKPICSLRRGSDAREIHQFKEVVYKFYDAEFQRRAQLVALHNFLFGDETPYKIEGCVIDDSTKEKYIVVSQPFITDVKSSGDAARIELKAELEARFGEGKIEIISPKNTEGYGELEGDWYIHSCHLALDDLKDANIFINKRTNKVAVIDCIISEMSHGAWYKMLGIADSSTLTTNEPEQNLGISSDRFDFEEYMRSIPQIRLFGTPE